MRPNPPVDPTHSQFGQAQAPSGQTQAPSGQAWPAPGQAWPAPGPASYQQAQWNNQQIGPAPPPSSQSTRSSAPLSRLSAMLLVLLAVATILSFFLPTYEFDTQSQIIRQWITGRQTFTNTASGAVSVVVMHGVIAVILLFGLAAGLLALAVLLWLRSSTGQLISAALIGGAATYRALEGSISPLEFTLRQSGAHTLTGTFTLLIGGLVGIAACVLLLVAGRKQTTPGPVH